MRQKILKNISWLFFDKIIRILGGVIVGVWVARYLGPRDFGIMNYSIAYSSLFMLFVNLGLDKIIVREIVKKAKLTNYLLGSAFGLKLIGSIIAVTFVSVSLYFVKTDYLTRIIILIISAGFIFKSLDVIDFFYQSRVLSKFVVIARDFAFIISSLFKVFLIINEYSVIYFAIANVVDIFLSSLFLVIIYRRTGNYIKKWRFSAKIAKRLIVYCWPIAVGMFLVLIHMRIDQVMIGNMLDKKEVGIYSAAVRLAEFWYFIPGILVSSLMPYLVELRETNNKLYVFRLTQLYFMMFWMGVVVGVFVVMFGEEIIVLLFGDEYIRAYQPLVYSIWAGIFLAQSVVKNIWIISENLQFYRIISNSIAVLMNILLNILLIPLYGIIGAAFATLLTRFINVWLTPLLFVKQIRENTLISIKAINPYYLYKQRVV